jgi:hypothetical protein
MNRGITIMHVGKDNDSAKMALVKERLMVGQLTPNLNNCHNWEVSVKKCLRSRRLTNLPLDRRISRCNKRQFIHLPSKMSFQLMGKKVR